MTKTMQAVIVFLLVFFLGANIFFSQNISPLLSKVLSGDKTAIIEFLSKIKKLPEFKNELDKYSKDFSSLKEQVFASDSKRDRLINQFEQVLQSNPKASDALYSLSLLYGEKGDTKKSQEFLKKAKKIDPQIK